MEELKDFQKRVIAERDELQERMKKLLDFMGLNPVFDTLPKEEQKDMIMQAEFMAGYAVCLDNRINRFKKEK